MKRELKELGKELVWLLSDWTISYIDTRTARWQTWVDEGTARWYAFRSADDQRMSEGSARAPFDTMQHLPTARARVAAGRARAGRG